MVRERESSERRRERERTGFWCHENWREMRYARVTSLNTWGPFVRSGSSVAWTRGKLVSLPMGPIYSTSKPFTFIFIFKQLNLKGWLNFTLVKLLSPSIIKLICLIRNQFKGGLLLQILVKRASHTRRDHSSQVIYTIFRAYLAILWT